MPYKPGVYIENLDEFKEKKAKWENLSCKKYSYTYSRIHRAYSDNIILDVNVDGDNITYNIKSYMNKTENDMTREEWEKYILDVSNNLNKEFFTINAVYNEIDSTISKYIAKGNDEKFSDCYYAKADFVFSEEAPFLASCECFSMTMQEEYVGGVGKLGITISNFVCE